MGVKMKITKIVMGILAAVSLAAAIAIGCNGDDKVIAIGPVSEMILQPVFALLVPLLLFLICVLSLIERVGYGERKGLFIAGIAVFGIATAFVGFTMIKAKDDMKIIKKLESPDGRHMIYYYDTTFTDILLDEEVSGITTLRRTGPFTYEKAMRCPDSMKETIDWGDDYYSPYAGREKYEYSSYGDK